MTEPTKFITLKQAKYLEKRMGAWIWDGLLFNQDSIVNPKLQLLPNTSGSRIRRVMAIIQDLENLEINTESI